jgi:sigma-B regulation protein RsbU (phosphoserine phosphatase)
MPAKILIVDDEPDLELLVRQRFRRQTRAGAWEFRFARNGEEALAAVAADPGIEVVLSDINMPVMDGLTLLARLRERRDPPTTVIVSAYGDMPNIRAAMNQGAFDFLTKPIDFRDFELTVEKTLAHVRRLRSAAAEHDRLVALERDLRTAALIQQSFLPPAPPASGRPEFALHAATMPARAVGGDFYDHFLLKGGRLGVVVGDVAGKGVPAALFMAVARTLLRAGALRGTPPGPCLAEVNRQLLRDTAAELFVTLFFGVLDPDTGELAYASGGHTPPYLLRAGGGIETLEGRNLIVGAIEWAAYETYRDRLAPGDRLFLYSDGIPEAVNAAREPFGDGRLREALGATAGASPEETVRRALDEVRAFCAGFPPSDDVTALAVLYRGLEDDKVTR